jgi:AbrB-like transcriptional regulator
VRPSSLKSKLMSNKKDIEPLVGEELLQKVKDLGSASKEDKARECGYFTETKNGVQRVNMMKFLNALIDAEGIQLDSKAVGGGRGGRSASYKITVQSNNNLLIGAAYTKQMGLKEGDVFNITLGRKHIHLKQVDGSEDDE